MLILAARDEVGLKTWTEDPVRACRADVLCLLRHVYKVHDFICESACSQVIIIESDCSALHTHSAVLCLHSVNMIHLNIITIITICII